MNSNFNKMSDKGVFSESNYNSSQTFKDLKIEIQRDLIEEKKNDDF